MVGCVAGATKFERSVAADITVGGEVLNVGDLPLDLVALAELGGQRGRIFHEVGQLLLNLVVRDESVYFLCEAELVEGNVCSMFFAMVLV